MWVLSDIEYLYEYSCYHLTKPVQSSYSLTGLYKPYRGVYWGSLLFCLRADSGGGAESMSMCANYNRGIIQTS